MRWGFWPSVFIGASIGLVILCWGYFQIYAPNMEEAKNYDKYYQDLKTQADLLPRAVKRHNDAIDKIVETDRDWARLIATRTPPPSTEAGGLNLNVNAWQMTIDIRKFRNNIQAAVDRQLTKGGVKVISGPSVPFPSTEAGDVISSFLNYPQLPFPVVVFNFGDVTVQGTYAQIKANMESYSYMPNYLAVADGLRLNGTSPILTGTYSLSIVGFIPGGTVFDVPPGVSANAGDQQQGGGPRGPAPGKQTPRLGSG